MKKLFKKLMAWFPSPPTPDSPTFPIPATVVPEPTVEAAPEAESVSPWVHNDNLYKLFIPNTAFDPNSNESAFMGTVITNKETGDCRLIPYINIPVASRTTTVVSGTSGEVVHTREWEIIGDES